REVIRQVPIEALVLETDAPYLTPHPYRGKRNAPGYIPLIAAEIAKSHDVSIEKVEEITTYNAINLYQIPKELLPE
ncbi:MAG TPA: hydrolase TatD, partial [Phaeodactylibacter sp.]|nr:hydrolase TatD [Phaeodactylibacter sp.]